MALFSKLKYFKCIALIKIEPQWDIFVGIYNSFNNIVMLFAIFTKKEYSNIGDRAYVVLSLNKDNGT